MDKCLDHLVTVVEPEFVRLRDSIEELDADVEAYVGWVPGQDAIYLQVFDLRTEQPVGSDLICACESHGRLIRIDIGEVTEDGYTWELDNPSARELSVRNIVDKGRYWVGGLDRETLEQEMVSYLVTYANRIGREMRSVFKRRTKS